MRKKREESKVINLSQCNFRIEDEAQLLANRIALLKQEEVKTWKKIEETRKRANEVKTLKRKNEDRVSSVSDNQKCISITTLEIIPTPKSIRPYLANPEQHKENETNERELKNISTTSDSSRKNG